jgi:transposase
VDVIYPCCAGLDVHKKTVVACVRTLRPDGTHEAVIRSFGTFAADLLELGDWLAEHRVERVAMESTGVYWKPVYHLLEDRFEVLLVNAAHIKQVPGRKTDVKDAEWIAQLLQYGLLRPSFIPPPPIRELRDLTRRRTQLVRDRATVANRIQATLEDAGVKLGDVASDVLGASGRAMLERIVAGCDDPEQLAELARGRLREKLPQLRRALCGRVGQHHRFLLGTLLEQVRQFEAWIARYDGRIAEVTAPFSEAAERLATIPGVSRRAAEVILAEIGPEMGQFPTAGHLASWAGMSPGNHQSAGKRQHGRTTKGSRWLRATLVQVAWAASHTKATIFSATYRRWARRLGKKRALVALGHKLLRVIYRMLKDGTDYSERLVPGRAA